MLVLDRAREAELSYQESANHAKESQVSLHVAVARLTRENIELRSALALAQQATEPSIVQLRQVMLDPAVNAEMLRLQKELETAKQEAAILLDASRVCWSIVFCWGCVPIESTAVYWWPSVARTHL